MTDPTGAPPPTGKKGFGSFLKQQVGPLPMGAWLFIVGAGLGIAYYTYRKNQAAKAAATPSTVPDASVQAGVGEGGQQFIYQAPDTVVGGNNITNNDEWANAAINFLIASGYEATVADQAIRTYLAGQSLSLQQASLVNLALQKFGAPPTPLPPGPPLPTVPLPPAPPVKPTPKPPAKPPAPKPTKFRYVTVTHFPSPAGTLWNIAQTYYHNGNEWPKIFNANKYGTRRADGTPGMIKNPNLIYPGWRLIVP